MVTQFKDCIDFLKYLYPDFDFFFLFNHSSGHAKKRVDGLDALAMNRMFGGQKSTMRPSLIPKNQGYVGEFYFETHPEMVTIGEEQPIVFPTGKVDLKVNGPWWMDEAERKKRINDHKLDDQTERDKTVKELLTEMRSHSDVKVDTYDPSKWKYPQLIFL